MKVFSGVLIGSSLLYVIFKDGEQKQYEDSEDVRESLIDNPSVEHVETSNGEVLKKYGKRIESSANRNSESFYIFSKAILKSSRNFSRDWRHSASVIPISKKTVKSFFDDGSWNWEDTVAIVGELEGRPAVIFGADSKYPKLEEQVGLFNDQSLNDIGYFMFENYVHNDTVFSIPGARYLVLK